MLHISVFFIISHQNGFVHIHKELNEKQARRSGLRKKREKKKKKMDETAGQFTATVPRQNVLSRAH